MLLLYSILPTPEDKHTPLIYAYRMANKNLNAAKTAPKDELYTQMTDIERELHHHWKHFRDKVVLCNCDDAVDLANMKYLV